MSELGKQSNATGYGLMGFTWRPNPPPLEQALEAMRAAVQNGATIWNAGEFYGTPEYNSMTIVKHYFTKYPEDAEKVSLYIKGGLNPDTFHPDGSPEGIRKSIDNILSQIGGVKSVDGFACARRDPTVPLKQTLEVIQREYIDSGKIGAVYLSECGAETIEEAVKHAKIVAAEVEVSMFTPDILRNGIADACARHGITVLAYSPIGNGILTGRFTESSQFKDLGMIGSSLPRLQQDALDHNLKLVQQVKGIAEEKGCTPAQLAINWVRALGNGPKLPRMIPIPGATTVARVKENSEVIEFTDEEMKKINEIVEGFQTAGMRYPEGVPTNT